MCLKLHMTPNITYDHDHNHDNNHDNDHDNDHDFMYTIQNSQLIIHNTFNNDLNKLLNTINPKTHPTIITSIEFSDVIGTDIFSSFDQPITLLPKTITDTRFGSLFNSHATLYKTILTVHFGDFFNQHLKPSKNLKNLHFGLWFNQPIDLPKHISKTTFGFAYNQPFILNKHMKILSLDKHFTQIIYLIEELGHLSINTADENILDNIPNCVKNMSLPYSNVGMCWNVPNSIDKIIVTMPKYLQNTPMKLNKLGTYKAHIKLCCY